MCYQLPISLLRPGGKGISKDGKKISLADWAYEECDPTWEDAPYFGRLIRKIQTAQPIQAAKGSRGDFVMTGDFLKRHIRLEGTVTPVEHDGKFYSPRSMITQSIIKPAVSEAIALEVLRGYGNAQSFCEERRLYELFDIYLPDVKMAVDVKYWSSESILRAEIDDTELEKAKDRLRYIRNVLGNDAKLIYVLFLNVSNENRMTPYVYGQDDNAPFEDRISNGDIVVVRMLDQEDFSLTAEFVTFCQWLRNVNRNAN